MEVSRPPEYASTTFLISAIVYSSVFCRWTALFRSPFCSLTEVYHIKAQKASVYLHNYPLFPIYFHVLFTINA